MTAGVFISSTSYPACPQHPYRWRAGARVNCQGILDSSNRGPAPGEAVSHALPARDDPRRRLPGAQPAWHTVPPVGDRCAEGIPPYNGCSSRNLPVHGEERHDSGNRGTRILVANESASDRAERLAVIARLRRIYPDDFISATYGDIN